MQFASGGTDEELEDTLLEERRLLLDENTELEDLTLLEEITELEDFTLLDELILLELFMLDVLELVFPWHFTPFNKNSVGLMRLVPLGKDRLKPKLID